MENRINAEMRKRINEEDTLKDVNRHMKAVENAVEHIAFVRRMAEVSGTNMEEFDKRLDELCSKYHAMYADMNEMQLALHGLADIIKSGRGEEFMKELFASVGDE